MKLTVLGSGTSVPHPRRSSPGFWLTVDNVHILLDIGADAPHRMAEERLDWPNVDAIWISHFHLDHFGGLVPFLFSLRWAPQTQTRTKALSIYGPKGLKTLINTFSDANNYRLLEQRFPVELIEVFPNEQFQIIPGLTARTLKTPHTDESLALELKTRNRQRLVYTSDTGFTEELTQFAKEVDLLLVESSFRKDKPVQTHLELTETMTLARACAARKVVLTHFYPEWDDFEVALEAKALWKGDVVEATDGLVLMI